MLKLSNFFSWILLSRTVRALIVSPNKIDESQTRIPSNHDRIQRSHLGAGSRLLVPISVRFCGGWSGRRHRDRLRFLVGCYGYRRAAISSLVFFGVVAILCVVRHFEISDRMGYSQWHARRSLEALAWSIPWFIGAGCFSLLRKTKSTGEQAGDGDNGEAF